MKKRLLAAFLSLVMVLGMLPTTALAVESEAVELDISKGSIIITENGYKQGDAAEETSHTGGYVITQTSNESPLGNYIKVDGNTTVEITLNGVNLSGDSTNAPFTANNGANVTIVLQGNNTLAPSSTNPGLFISGATSVVTIKVPDGEADTYGILTAKGNGGERPGIGGTNAGTVNIQSGTITAVAGGGYVSGIGPSRRSSMVAVNISGGHIVNTGDLYLGTCNTPHGNRAVTISGGYIETKGVGGGSVKISGGTVVTSDSPGISPDAAYDASTPAGAPEITGGNIGDAYNSEISGRTLTRLYFANEDGSAIANTEVTVTEGIGDDTHTWTALTDDEGMVTTYLADGTASVSAVINGGESEAVTISNGLGVVGAECTCDENSGTLTMITQSQGLTVTNGTATLELDAVYAKDSCVLPDGFHGDYETISYDITRVVKNGQYQTEDRYASISGNTLTVYDETNADSYTVYVWAKCGPSGSEVYSGEIAISVGTYVSEVGEGELDIGLGSIIITDTGYSQGTLIYNSSTGYSVQDADGTAVTETKWEESELHALSITGSSTTNTILIMGGSPKLTLKDVSILQESANTPGLVLMSGSSENTATLVLEGTNTLTGSDAPGVQINKNATLTIQGDGVLNATGANDHAGIGATNGDTFVVDPTRKTNDKSYRAGGNLVINGGTITAVTGSNQNAGIGNSRSVNFGDITINGGVIQATGRYYGIRTGGGNVTISGGIVSAHITNSTNDSGHCAISGQSVTVSGGTLASLLLDGNQLTGKNALRATDDGATVSITGGNVNSYYAEEIEGRTRTKLYFVNANGTPQANTMVTVQEGESAAWSAYTDENGVVTTYFASNTESIKAAVGETVSDDTVPLSNDQALIGGTCSCTKFSGIAWNSGLPETVTLYENEQTITVADAELVTTDTCAMPIHPSLPAITYSLAVKNSSGEEIAEESEGDYATLSGNTLTLKKQNDSYTVTLTAKAGEDEATCTVEVLSGSAEEGTATITLTDGSNVTITYDEANGYTAKWGEGEGESVTSESGSFVPTGNAPTASITVESGTPTLTLNQASADNVWTVFTSGEGTSATLIPSAVNGKVRFGAEGAYEAVQGVLTAKKLKLNPEAGTSIAIGQDGKVTQGEFTIAGLDSRTLAVYGANLDGETSITNNSGTAVSVDVNDSQSTLAADSSITIPQAGAIFNGGPEVSGENDDNVRGYIYDNGTKLVYAGEGVATVGDRAFWSTEEYLPYRETVTQAAFDPDISTIGYAAVYQLSGIEKLEIKYATTVASLYNARMKELWLGDQVTTYTSGTYLYNLETITLEESNTALMLDDGVLYTADGATLLQCPQAKTGSYTLLDTCRTISGNAFFGSSLSNLTLNAGLTSIGSQAFEDATIQTLYVEAGNTAFQSIDGVLYTADGKTMILCPAGRTESALVIPEGVTGMADMAIWQAANLTSITLPASLENVDGHFLVNTPIEEMTINGMLYPTDTGYVNGNNSAKFFDSQVLRSLTVPEGYNLAGSKFFNNTSMSWVTGVSVTGGEDVPYDGESHGVTVTGPEGATVEYSADGVTYSTGAAHTYTESGDHTVYWRVTYNGGTVYSQASFTITELEASEDWFTLTAVKPEDAEEGWTPVELNQPEAAPSLENGYTVTYSKDGTGTPTGEVPTETGNYLVKVNITANGYAKETLTLGYYTILASGSSEKVLSFVTYGGTAIEPIVGVSGTSITWPSNPTYAGYEFGGWYTDATLRTPLETSDIPTSMPSESDTYYAKWTREEYLITYNVGEDATHNNPATYNVETPDFTLEAPVRPGYEFTGWTWNGQDEPDPEVTIQKGSYGDKTYTANWETSIYNITYDSQWLQQTEPSTYTVETESITLTKPNDREGYSFLGWTVQNQTTGMAFNISPEADGSGTISQTVLSSLLGNITVSGMWLADDVTLILNANGGQFSNGDSTLTISAKFDSSPTLEAPSRSGYNFAGWYTDEGCTIPFGNTVTGTGTVTLYAGWTAIPTGGGGGGSTTYTVSAPSSVTGGNVSVSPSRASRGSTVTITVTPDEGYELDTLTVTDSDGNTLTLTDKGDGKYTFTMPRGAVEITASFKAVSEEPSELPFTDVAEGAWYYDAVAYAYDNGLMGGTSASTFAPGTTTNRAMLATLLYRLEGEPAVTGASFTDVAAGQWYTDAVAWAAAEGIVNGVGDGSAFAPNDTITREQMAVMLYRYAQYKGYDVTGSADLSGYTDAGSISSWAEYAMAWAVDAGLISGTSAATLSPQGSASRAEIATILMRFCENVVK